jgi:hypothetical protein
LRVTIIDQRHLPSVLDWPHWIKMAGGIFTFQIGKFHSMQAAVDGLQQFDTSSNNNNNNDN